MKDGFKVIDCELHLEEPFDLWERYLDEPYRSRTALHRSAEGHQLPGAHQAELNGKIDAPAHGTALIQRQAKRRWKTDPLLLKARTSCTPEVYVEGLDMEGIDVAILSPTVSMSLIRHDDLEPEHAIAICRAYNNWASEFAQKVPERFRFWALLPPHDATLAARELRRCVKELGAIGGATIQGAINGHLFSDEWFDPLWSEVNDLNVPMGFHIAFGGSVREEPRARYAGHRHMEILANALGQAATAPTTVAELIMGGVFERYPKMRALIMEGCVSWIPWLLWRLDEKWETFGPDMDIELSLKPSEYFPRQCWAVVECEEDIAKYFIDFVGDRNLLISTDYPHHDSPFPYGISTFLGLPSLSQESKRKILWDNGADLFRLNVPQESRATAGGDRAA